METWRCYVSTLWASRARRAEAAHAPKREHQERENVKRSKLAGGLERSDRIKRRPSRSAFLVFEAAKFLLGLRRRLLLLLALMHALVLCLHHLVELLLLVVTGEGGAHLVNGALPQRMDLVDLLLALQ